MRKILVLQIFLIILPVQAQVVSPVIDNPRVTVRDVTLVPGRPGVLVQHDTDFAIMFLTGGKIRTTDAAGKTRIVQRQAGGAVYGTKGTEEKNEVVSELPARLVMIELKDFRMAPTINKTGYPAAFPRPGSKKVLENNRIVVWNYDWTLGKPTPLHYHDKDVVLVYRGNGTLKSVTPDGKGVTTEHKFGEIRFNKGDRSHYELLTSGQQGAIMMELK
jgi:hypothetical protein